MGQTLFDRYSYWHVLAGIIAQLLGVNFWTWHLIHMLFESLENTSWGIWVINHYLSWWPGGKTAPDTLINSVGDLLSGSIGWLIAFHLKLYV